MYAWSCLSDCCYLSRQRFMFGLWCVNCMWDVYTVTVRCLCARECALYVSICGGNALNCFFQICIYMRWQCTLYAVATHSIVFFKYVSICGGNALCMRWQRTQLFCSNMHLYAVATHSVCGGNALNHFFSNTKLPICIDSFAKET